MASGQSIVSLYGCHTSKQCGYCPPERKGKVEHTTFGMAAAQLTVDDYQELLDRGWRRSGTYLYKHDNMTACCPNLTIRLDVSRFVASKKQNRLLRRAAGVTAQLQKRSQRSANTGPDPALRALAGQLRQRVASVVHDPALGLGASEQLSLSRRLAVVPVAGAARGTFRCNLLPLLRASAATAAAAAAAAAEAPADNRAVLDLVSKACSSVEVGPAGVATGVTWSLRDQMLRAVVVDLAAQEPKEPERDGGGAVTVPADAAPPTAAAGGGAASAAQAAAQLSDWRVEVLPAAFRPEAFALYKRYQMAVHHDPEEKLSEKGYKRFLCDSPLIRRPLRPSERAARDPPPVSECLVGFKGRSEAGGLGAEDAQGGTALRSGFGSFHHHVYFRERLVAVEVVDVLPRCLSSVYVFSDPEEPRLELGKWTALRAVQWVQVASRVAPALQYYYMGYYVPNCGKMVYKAEYRPSQLLCQVTGRWVALPRALQCLAAAARNGKPCAAFAPTEQQGAARGAVGEETAEAAAGGPLAEGAGWDLPVDAPAVQRLIHRVPLAIGPTTPPVLISQLVPRAMEVLGEVLSQYVQRVGSGLASGMLVGLYSPEGGDGDGDEDEA